MRQATVQPLHALGLVEGSGDRFNSFTCTEIGAEFISEAYAEIRPNKRAILDHLYFWATGESGRNRIQALRDALSPLEPLKQSASFFLRERIIQGSGHASRRRRAAAWMESVRQSPDQLVSWDKMPSEVEPDHWKDMHAGALFFATRRAALEVLDRIETHLANRSDLRMSLDDPIPDPVLRRLEQLRDRSRDFLGKNYDPSPGNAATIFCQECVKSDGTNSLEHLLAREGRGLQLRGRDIMPGPAFRGKQNDQAADIRNSEDAGAETLIRGDIPLPQYISHRVGNLFRLNLDLRNELDAWLSQSRSNEVAT
jgi:hypothetical protein